MPPAEGIVQPCSSTARDSSAADFEILALCGSLRAASINSMVLKAACLLAKEGATRRRIRFNRYHGISELPFFSPDLEGEVVSRPLEQFRAAVVRADAILIACPEYARGIPGAFKNALDWLIGGSEVPGKPVALLNTSARACEAQAALKRVLTTMSMRLVEEACVTLDLLGREVTAESIAADPGGRAQLVTAMERLCESVELRGELS